MIKLIKTILLRDSNGNNLRLTLGKIKDMEAYNNRFMGFANNDGKGFRWRFVGPKIPMPIRSYEWFNGFPEEIMVPWVKSQGYEVVAVTSHVTGSVYVVKGNETPVTTAVNPDDASKSYESAPVKYVVDTGEDDGFSVYIYDNFCKANDHYQALLIGGYPNPHLYKATEYGKDDKRNETYKLTEQAIRNGNEALTEAIKLLCSQGMVLKAISLYRFIHTCCLKDAKEAVDKIRFP